MPTKWTVFYFTPLSGVPSCPAYEPNSIDGEYSQQFRHIQYKRTPSLRSEVLFAPATRDSVIYITACRPSFLSAL